MSIQNIVENANTNQNLFHETLKQATKYGAGHYPKSTPHENEIDYFEITTPNYMLHLDPVQGNSYIKQGNNEYIIDPEQQVFDDALQKATQYIPDWGTETKKWTDETRKVFPA